MFVYILAWPDGGAAVTIDNFAFSPATLTVAKGTDVTWTNKDDISHTVVLLGTKVRSKAIDTGQSFSCRFDETGTFSYVCGIHPRMHGQVIVW